MQFIDLARQQDRIRSNINSRIAQVLAHGHYILGPEVAELEGALAERTARKHCIGVANGTDALQLALMAYGIGPGDEVITPAFSYIAASEMIALLGATPVLVDIDPVSFNVSAKAIEAAITPKTKAIIPVDLFGQCADYEAIVKIADPHDIPVFEDAAQSFGATRKGKPSCSFGAVATTSFFPSKPLGCYGDGGACFTDDDEIASLLRSMRAHGQARRYYHVRVGINARLDTMQAAILLAKLEIFDDEIGARAEAAKRYEALLRDASLEMRGLTIPRIDSGNTTVWAQYTVRVPNREKIRETLKQAGIPTAVHYPQPLQDQEVFAGRARVSGDLVASTKAAEEVMSLPMHPYLEANEQERIVEQLGKALKA